MMGRRRRLTTLSSKEMFDIFEIFIAWFFKNEKWIFVLFLIEHGDEDSHRPFLLMS